MVYTLLMVAYLSDLPFAGSYCMSHTVYIADLSRSHYFHHALRNLIVKYFSTKIRKLQDFVTCLYGLTEYLFFRIMIKLKLFFGSFEMRNWAFTLGSDEC